MEASPSPNIFNHGTIHETMLLVGRFTYFSIFDMMLYLDTGISCNIKRWAFILFMGFMIAFSLASCSSHTTKAQRKADKRMEKDIRKSEKVYKKDVKRHNKIQSQGTRKMIRNSKKQSKKYNKKKMREPFGLLI